MYNEIRACLLLLNFCLFYSQLVFVTFVQKRETGRSSMEIGSKLKELRVLKGLTQEELADRAELSKGFISQLNVT